MPDAVKVAVADMDLGAGNLETHFDKADAVYNALKPDLHQVAAANTKENSGSTDRSKTETPAVAAFRGRGRGRGLRPSTYVGEPSATVCSHIPYVPTPSRSNSRDD